MTEEVEKNIKKIKIGWAILTLIGVLAIFVIVALIGFPWYIAAIPAAVFVFVMGWLEAEQEDKVLVKKFGPWKK